MASITQAAPQQRPHSFIESALSKYEQNRQPIKGALIAIGVISVGVAIARSSSFIAAIGVSSSIIGLAMVGVAPKLLTSKSSAEESPMDEFEELLAPIQDKIDANVALVLGDLHDEGIRNGDLSRQVKKLISYGALATITKGPFADGPEKATNLKAHLQTLQAEDSHWSQQTLDFVLALGAALKADLDTTLLYQKNSKIMKEEVSEFLSQFNLEIQEVKGDGNCFFRAAAVAEGKTQDDHAEYRRKAVSQLRKDGSPIVARARKDMEYAQQEEVEALSKSLKRPVVIVMWRGSLDKEVPPRTRATSIAAIRKMGFDDPRRSNGPLVVTLAGNHYNLVPTEGKDLTALLAHASI